MMTINFIPMRLKEAREIRGCTMSELGKKIGVTRAAISQFENGTSTPSAKSLAELAMALNVPINYFTSDRPRRTKRTSPIFFRKFDSATKKSRKQAKRYEEWLADICESLLNYLDFPEPNIVSIEKDYVTLDDDDIEQIAIDVRTSWNLGIGAISNISLLFQNNGIFITRINLDDKIDSFSCWRDKRPIIALVSNNKTAVRSRFDAVHELAHLVLHKDVSDEELDNKKLHALIEKQAHKFTGAFLMPAESFSKDFISPSLPILKNMKKKWGVSIAAMTMRASDLGFLTDNQKSNIFRQLSAQGYRRKEPYDDEILPEKPVLLERAIKMLIENNIITGHELLDMLNLSINDLKEISNVNYSLLNFENNVLDINFKEAK